MTVQDRFWAKVAKGSDNECWVWQAARSSNGYGTFYDGARTVRAHRFAYEAAVGLIPEGLTIDHLCRTRACVNPAHLEPVTSRENILRGTSPSALHAVKTHCPRGHELSGENLGIWPGSGRRCRECVKARQRKDALIDPEKRRIQKRDQKRRARAKAKIDGETP